MGLKSKLHSKYITETKEIEETNYFYKHIHMKSYGVSVINALEPPDGKKKSTHNRGRALNTVSAGCKITNYMYLIRLRESVDTYPRAMYIPVIPIPL